MGEKVFPWTMLFMAYAAENGYKDATPERQDEIINEFIGFMQTKLYGEEL